MFYSILNTYLYISRTRNPPYKAADRLEIRKHFFAKNLLFPVFLDTVDLNNIRIHLFQRLV